MYIDFNKIDGYIEDNNKSKYLTLISVDKNKGAIKRYKEIRNKIKYLTESENNGSGNSDDKYMKVTFHSNDNLPLKKELEMHGVVINIRSVFNNNKY